MAAQTYIVRKSRRQDCCEIVRLVKEMSEYEKLADQFKLSEKELEEDGFGDQPLFQCIVAEDTTDGAGQGSLIGYCVYYFTYSTFQGRSLYLEDLYVTATRRRQGAGMAMLRQLAKVGVETKCARLDFIVLNWNQSSIEFYKKLGAEDLTQTEKWHLFRLEKQHVEALAESL